jgi:CrcB protein
MTTDEGDLSLPIDPDVETSATAPRPRPTPDVLLLIAIGGMIGASARYGIARWLPVESGTFPWATFWTNLSGSFVLGFVLVVFIDRFPRARRARAFVATGMVGAYTTMSTLAVESSLLVRDGSPMTAVVYVLASLAGGLALVTAGIALARSVVTSGSRT